MILDDEDILIQSVIDSISYEMVDLGLSVKWANKNIGAYNPEDAGLYFQWGDTVGYTADQVSKDKVFNWSSYKFGERSNLTKYNSTDGLKVLESSDDAATVYMGSQYRMPTRSEIRELINNTTLTFIDLDGNEYSKEKAQNRAIKRGKLKGVRFTGSNGNSIFIPAAGYCGESLLDEVGVSCELWSSSLYSDNDDYAKFLSFDYDGFISEYSRLYRCCGQSIRGVKKTL